MQWRAFLERHSTAAAAVCIAVILAAAGAAYWFSGGDDPVGERTTFYYDLNENRLFVGPSTLAQAVDAPSGALRAATGPLEAGGPAGVHVLVFACGEGGCGNEASRVPGALTHGSLLRDPAGGEWVAGDGPEGRAIMQQVFARCGEAGAPCEPPAAM